MNMFAIAKRCGMMVGAGLICGTTAWAQAQPPSTSAGPGRITCPTISTCDLGVGSPPSIRYKIDASSLPDADKTRLVKQCTAKATPCIATVDGTEAKAVIKAAKIKFYN